MRKLLGYLAVLTTCLAGPVLAQGNVIISDLRQDKSVSAPLVVMLHGAGSNGKTFKADTRFDRLARARGVIVAYPDWQDLADAPAERPALLAGVIAQLQKDARVSEGPAVVIGHGAGAILALALSCMHPNQIAGLGVVAANAPAQGGCNSGPAKPAIFVHGTADSVFPHNGGASAGLGTPVLSATETVDAWIKRNGCTDSVRVNRIDRAAGDGTRVVMRDYTRCRAATSQVLVLGGGHSWPAGRGRRDPTGGRVTAEFNASEVLLGFLAPLVGR